MPITVENLSYCYGSGTPFETQALRNVSLSVADGEFIGIMGHTDSVEIFVKTVRGYMFDEIAPAKGGSYLAAKHVRIAAGYPYAFAGVGQASRKLFPAIYILDFIKEEEARLPAELALR